MYIIELTLKNTPIPLSVQRKSAEDAEEVYKQILAALRGDSQLLELTCERQPDKKVAVFSSEICAVQIYEKSGASAAGRAPGFFAVTQ